MGSGMAWILFGALLLAIAFFVVVFAQVLSIESRLRKLVVSTESRLALVYGLRLTPPDRKKKSEEAESEAEAEESEG